MSSPSRRPILRALLAAGLVSAVAWPAMAQGQLDPRIRWRVVVPGYATTNFVATAPDGTVYVNSDDGLMALDANGGLEWEVPNTSQRLARPIHVAAEGTLYVGGLGFGQITALHPDGSVRWAHTPDAGSGLVAGPSVGLDGNIYAIADGLGTYSLDPEGNLRWVGDYELTTAYNNAPIWFDSERFFAAVNHFGGGPSLHVYDLTDGMEIWGSASLGIPWTGFPALDPLGRVIGPRWPTYVQALRAEDGHVEWYSQHPGLANFLIQKPQVGSDGVIYTTDISGGDLWAIDPDGSTRWFLPHDLDESVSQLGVSPDNRVIVAVGVSDTRWLRGYDTADGGLLWEVELEPENGVDPFVSAFEVVFTPDSRTAYVATNFLGDVNDYGYLYAVALDTGPTLSITGVCPGAATLRIAGATPGGELPLARGSARGSFTVPGGPCAGTELDLSEPRLVRTLRADPAGDVDLDVELPAAACGAYLQAVDRTTCATSDAVRIP